MYNGFVRVAAAVPLLKVADCDYNVKEILKLVKQAEVEKVQVLCFPELCITGYTCGDLFFQQHLQEQANEALAYLLGHTKTSAITLIVGMPVWAGTRLFNAALVLQSGHIVGAVPKSNLPTHDEFYEKRWFAPAIAAKSIPEITLLDKTVPFGTSLLFSDGTFSFAIEICEDVWMPIPPSSQHALSGAEIIFNLSASNELVGKDSYRRKLVEVQSGRCAAGYVYVASGVGESTSDLVFAGNAYIADNGYLLYESERFLRQSQLTLGEIDVQALRFDRSKNTNFDPSSSSETYRTIALQPTPHKTFALQRSISKMPFVPIGWQCSQHCNDVFAIQTAGLAKRWEHTGAKSMVVGVSGGLDSTLALLVCVKTADLLGYDRQRILAITMPGFGTSTRTQSNAQKLAYALGVGFREISICDAAMQHFKDIGHNPLKRDIIYENTQARERTQILMDIANEVNGLVVGTGDLSELALGWTTYNGDQMSMYGVNAGVPKTLVRALVAWVAQQMDVNTQSLLNDVLETPISPELLPIDKAGKTVQKTEDIIGPYELHDFFLYHFLRSGSSPERLVFLAKQAFGKEYTKETINKWLKVFLQRFFTQQFKRSAMPDGPKVGTINLSPRGDWRMPSDVVPFSLPSSKETTI
ncbi:NAD(+) synthase [Bacteroidia bacterium]|nr:NAD(+) synthase [Bacteroidia bacterium]